MSSSAFRGSMESVTDLATNATNAGLQVEGVKQLVESIQDDNGASEIEFIDDRDIAKCSATAVPKSSSKKGFSSLCTDIAPILKQSAKSRRKLQYSEVRLKDSEVAEFISEPSTSGYSQSAATRSPRQAEHNMQKSGTRVAVKENDNTEVSHWSDGSVRTKYLIVTKAVVHAAQSPDQIEKSASGCSATTAKCASVNEFESQENHQPRLPLPIESKSLSSSPERTFSRCGQVSSKSRSLSVNESPSSGSPKLTNIYEDLPLDLSGLNALSIDEPVECLSEACCTEGSCKATRNDTGEQCSCSRQWIDKYSEMSQRYKKIEQELEALREELKNPRNLNRHPNQLSAEKTRNNNSVEERPPSAASVGKQEQRNDSTEPDWLRQLMRQNLTPLMAPNPLKGCKCSVCELEIQHLVLKAKDEDEIAVFQLVHKKGKPLLEVSAIVMIPGNTIARVAYIGHLDSTEMPAAVFVGVTIDKPIGNSDGRNGGKRYFLCEPKHGIFMPINQILFVIRHAADIVENTQRKAPVGRTRSKSHPGRMQHHV